jgi:hypothetical protein
LISIMDHVFMGMEAWKGSGDCLLLFLLDEVIGVGGEGIGKGERYLREEANGVQSDYRCDAGECAECEDSEEKSFFAARALDGEEEGDGEREDEYVN